MLGLDTNIANKHMQISEPPSSQTVLGWIHFSSTVFASSQPSRAEIEHLNLFEQQLRISEPLSSQTVPGYFSSTVFGSSQPSRAERNV